MFEKEAEYYAKEKYSPNTDPFIIAVADDAFRDGAEFGYNKANEWHYVKDELPPKHVPLNIITLDKNKNKRLWEGEYQGGNGNWWSGYFNHFIDVPYAWKEIVLPEFSKEQI